MLGVTCNGLSEVAIILSCFSMYGYIETMLLFFKIEKLEHVAFTSGLRNYLGKSGNIFNISRNNNYYYNIQSYNTTTSFLKYPVHVQFIYRTVIDLCCSAMNYQKLASYFNVSMLHVLPLYTT